MRVSELIKNLQKEMDKYGDLLVTVYDSESFTYSLDVTALIRYAKNHKVTSIEFNGDEPTGYFVAIMDSINED